MTPPPTDEKQHLKFLHDSRPTALSRHEGAYNDGVAAGITMLECLTALREYSLSSEQPGRPTLDWEFARGLLDTLQPGLDDATTLLRSKVGARFVADLRAALLDDLIYRAEHALTIARDSPPRFNAYSEEW